MALSGRVETSRWTASNGSWYRTVVFEWSATQDISGNYSIINWTIKGGGSNNSYYVYAHEIEILIDGGREFYKSDINTKCYYNTVLASGSTKLNHNSDGSRAFSVTIKAGLYTYSINKTGSDSFTLDTIARASNISSVSNIELGNKCNVKWTPASQNFSYKLKFVLGNWSHTTDTISLNTTSEYTYSETTIPLDVAYEIPNSNSGTMTVYLYTYSNGSQIGSAASKTFAVTIPDGVAMPSVGFIVTADNSANSKIASWGVCVAGYTRAKITSVDESTRGAYGSTIKSFNIIGNTYNASVSGSRLSYTGSIITSSGNRTFSVEAVDSRGRKTLIHPEVSLDFYPYSAPTITQFNVSRSKSDSTKVIITPIWSFSSIGGKNTSTATLNYKKLNDDAWTTYSKNISNNVTTQLDEDFEETSSYDFILVVRDDVNQTTQMQSTISTTKVALDFKAGGDGISLGKIAEQSGFECDWDAQFNKDVKFKGNVEMESLTVGTISNFIEHGFAMTPTTSNGFGQRGYCYGSKGNGLGVANGDQYYLGVSSEKYLFIGTQINGVTTPTWTSINGDEDLLGLTNLSNSGSVTFTASGVFSAFVVYSYIGGNYDAYVPTVVTPKILGQTMGVTVGNTYYGFTLSSSGTTYTLQHSGSASVSYVVKGIR